MGGIMRYLFAGNRDFPVSVPATPLKPPRVLTLIDKEYDIYLKRATAFFGRLPRHFFKESRPLTASIGGSKEPVAWRDRDTLRYRPVGEKETWGGLWDSAWMKLSGEIPENWRGQPLACHLNPGGEILLFDAAGGTVALTLKPFEIKTYKLLLG